MNQPKRDTRMMSAPGLNPRDRQIGGDHYLEMDVQPWDAMPSWLSPAEWRGYLRGSALAYLARAGRKGPMLEDVEKARHYLDRLVMSLREQPPLDPIAMSLREHPPQDGVA